MSADQPTGPARAREAPPPLEREAHIRDLMVNLRYVKGRTVAELAERWGLAVGTVENDACRASATLIQAADDIPGARERMMTTAVGVLDALDEAVGVGNWNAVKSLVPALEVVRKVLGLSTPDAAASTTVQVAQFVDRSNQPTPAFYALVDEGSLAGATAMAHRMAGLLAVDPKATEAAIEAGLLAFDEARAETLRLGIGGANG